MAVAGLKLPAPYLVNNNARPTVDNDAVANDAVANDADNDDAN